ncbi:MAG TPA: hypothetical protein VFL95_11665 [Gemmatimonadales bacterium]|nr:hypothetical protein [Gemmatimonadales bacterium]
MTEPQSGDAVRAIRRALQMIDAQVDDAHLSADRLGEVKGDIDNIRLRIWAMMSAGEGGNGPALDRFRLRRALEVMHRLTGDLEQARIDPNFPELTALDEVSRQFIAALHAARAR